MNRRKEFVVFLISMFLISTTTNILANEILVPGAAKFPLGDTDVNNSTEVNYSYYMATYLVTYELWQDVYNWAIDDLRGEERFYFQNTGEKGNDGDLEKSNQHPVTHISWWDAVVWCNAFTDYYNYHNEAKLENAYTYQGEVVRDSRDSNEMNPDFLIANKEAKGYRLPTNDEWELAAKYQNGTSWTFGTHISGDKTGSIQNNSALGSSQAFDSYLWHKGNSNSSTQIVGTKLPNDLGIYDLSGNVWEWCFELETS